MEGKENVVELPEEVRQAAAALGDALAATDEVQAYLQAQARLEADPEARALEDRFQALYQDLLARQQAGQELPPEKVQTFYALRLEVQRHPLIARRDLALSRLKGYFADVALDLSTRLGADYTALVGTSDAK